MRTAGPFLLSFPIALALGALALPAASAAEPAQASLRIHAGERSPHAIPRYITGKFTEHLFNNIYGGIDAQILRNPTFAEYPFWTGEQSPDGISTFHFDRERISREIRRQGGRIGWPESELAPLIEAHGDGLACWWTRVGARDSVAVSPDTAPYGQRAQRVQVQGPGQGIAQWAYLPLHRTRKFEFEMFLRSPNVTAFNVSLAASGSMEPCAVASVGGVSSDWRKFTGALEVGADLPADAAYRFAIIAEKPGQFVIGRAMLRPADHVGGADPDVVRLLKESRLPIMRWPGGNFVSGYHWEDGIGSIEKRPTRPNYAWGNVEPNSFGTDEFIALCRAVGCEPMICLNAGSGTPEEGARWVEYCNGPASTPMGKLRAAGGHPEPYGVKHWEIGNELWGRWQFYWTTAEGYVDRYKRFSAALLAADSSIKIYACGAPVTWGKSWNDTLIRGAASILKTTTDHPLIGGSVSSNADPLDVFRDFMAVPDVLEKKWAALRSDMLGAGIVEPRLAITELQMFARVGGPSESGAPVRLTHANLVNPGTLGEALYDILYYHVALRLAPFVDLVTHSATVNHGGGLRKERERVYPNPCHHAQAAFAAFAGAIPVKIEIDAPSERAPLVLPELRSQVTEFSFKTVDALAALSADGDLLISIVHRAGAGPTRLSIELRDFAHGKSAEVRALRGEVPWAANSLSSPDAVRPVDSLAELSDGKLTLLLEPYSVLRVRVPRAR